MQHATLRGYGSILAEHLVKYFGPRWIDEIRPADVRRYLRARAESHSLSRQTMTNHLRLLRVIAADAHADGLCEKPFTLRVRAPRVPKKYNEDHPNALRAKDVGAVLLHLGARWAAMFTVMVFTGLRWSEASALLWTDYSASESVIRVRRGQTRGRVGDTKNEGSVRVVPVAPMVAAALEAYRKHEMAHCTLSDWIFPNLKGEVYSSWPLSTPLKQAIKAAGIPHKVTPHGLRRTFTALAAQVADRDTIMQICGWTTEEIYRHYRGQDRQAKADTVAGVVRLVKGDDA